MIASATKWMHRHELKWIYDKPDEQTTTFLCHHCNGNGNIKDGYLRCDECDLNSCTYCYKISQNLPIEGKLCKNGHQYQIRRYVY